MATVYFSPVGNGQTFFNSQGQILAGGKILTYAAGTTTPLATYTDNTGTVQNANPIILNSGGQSANEIWLTANTKFVIEDSSNNIIMTLDNIVAINNPSSVMSEWMPSNVVPTFLSTTQFSATGDQTLLFTVNRRVKITETAGTVYGYVSAASFATGVTTVTVVLDSGTLDSGISVVSVGLLNGSNQSVPNGLSIPTATITNLTTTTLNSTTGSITNLTTTTQAVGDNSTKGATNAFVQASRLSIFRNKLINGGMSIDQRNNGSAQTITAAAALAYTVDRWYAYCTGANVTGQRVAGSGSSQYRYQFTGAASVTAIGFAQRIEAINCYDLNNSTATLSVDLANSLLTTVTWTAYYANSADTFGTLASPTKTQIATGTFTVTGTVTNYSTQISIPSAAVTGIEILFTVGAQTSGTWTIGNVQLESGNISTPFERKSYEVEFAMSQRYRLHNSFVIGQTGSYNGGGPFPVTMRVAPTYISGGGAGWSLGSVTTSGFVATQTSGALQTIIWDAEL